MELRQAKVGLSLKEESSSSEDEAALAELAQVSNITAFWVNDEENDGKRSKGKNKPVKIYKCDKCDHSSPTHCDLMKHQRKHSESKDFECPEEGCSFRSRYPNNIKKHKLIHSDSRPHKCDVCGLSFKVLNTLTTHMLKHSDEKSVLCTMCPFRCKRMTELRSHHIHAHTTEKKFECDVCGLKTKFKSDLVKHMKRHIPVNEDEKVKCDICNKLFRDKSILRRHFSVHLDANSKCKDCGKIFKSDRNLQRHVQVVHLQEKNIVCEVCGAKFGNQRNKQVHMVTHDVRRKVSCPLCPYKGAEEFDLRAHIGCMHKEHYLVNYCKCCNKKFKKRNQLVQHLKTTIHKQCSTSRKWRDRDLFEYRLEPRGTYTKKSNHVTCLIPDAQTDPIQPSDLRGIKEEPTFEIEIKTEEDDEYCIPKEEDMEYSEDDARSGNNPRPTVKRSSVISRQNGTRKTKATIEITTRNENYQPASRPKRRKVSENSTSLERVTCENGDFCNPISSSGREICNSESDRIAHIFKVYEVSEEESKKVFSSLREMAMFYNVPS